MCVSVCVCVCVRVCVCLSVMSVLPVCMSYVSIFELPTFAHSPSLCTRLYVCTQVRDKTIQPQVDVVAPLSDAGKWHAALESRATVGKVLFDPFL